VLLVVLAASCSDPPSVPGNAVFVALSGGDELVAVDAAGRSVLARVKVGRQAQIAALTESGRLLVVSTGTNSVAVVEAPRIRVMKRITVGERPHQVAASPNSALAVVTNEGDASLTVIDVYEQKAAGRIAVDERPFHVAITPDGKQAWMTYQGKGHVTVVDLERMTRLQDLPLGRTPLNLRFSPDGFVWIADAESNAVLRVPGGEAHVWVDARGVIVPAASYPTGTYPIEVSFTPDGREAWVPNAVSNDVTVLETASGRQLARIPVGRNPLHVAFSADGRIACLSERDDNSVAVIDVASHAVIGRVLVGARPDGVVTGARPNR